MPREIRISPDGESVAIRTDESVEGVKAWGVMEIGRGGYWARATFVDGWEVIANG